MRAICFDAPGDESVLHLGEAEPPALEPGLVLVRVAAAGVNNADLAQRRGAYPPPEGASPILGLEVSGTIAEVADDVHGWSVGDRVCALLAGGGYAEVAAVPASQLLPVPDGVDLVEAAALPEAACTVQSNVELVRPLTADDVLLVHGGTGGVGSHAVAWARALGARVVATSGGPEKRAAAERIGAHVAIDYRAEDFVAAVLDATDGRGADVILDVVGADYLARNLEALATGGHIATIASSSDAAELSFGALMRKRASISGTTLRARPLAEKAGIVASVRERVWPLVASGAVPPIVDRVLPLEEAAEAHRLMAAGENVGKLLLRP